ncbi:hypothetical protein BJX66DRAFT_64818 [Aspergillus keveii]|uniref:Uncharacterized protein n=1 Tax=Aspergillus keveii TaxID=714993 RepID=A0ABR4GGD8_9EURO
MGSWQSRPRRAEVLSELQSQTLQPAMSTWGLLNRVLLFLASKALSLSSKLILATGADTFLSGRAIHPSALYLSAWEMTRPSTAANCATTNLRICISAWSLERYISVPRRNNKTGMWKCRSKSYVCKPSTAGPSGALLQCKGTNSFPRHAIGNPGGLAVYVY